MKSKKVSRLRRAKRSRMKSRELGRHRLTVFRSSLHTYAQLLSPTGDRVLASASTLEPTLRKGATANMTSAGEVGRLIAERALASGIKEVVFDRSGYKFHGRVKALAEAARAGGLSC